MTPPSLERLGSRAMLVGAVALALCVGGAFLGREQFFRSYLFAYLFWLGLALGSLALVMLHHLVGGGWGYVVQRLLEAGTKTLPLLALLFVPLLFGLGDLYAWARPAAVAADETLAHKRLYLNAPFFVARAALYFAVWIGVAHFLNRWSLERDRRPAPIWTGRLRRLSGGGLVLYALTVTFASIDWAMSLEPRWFSTIYGVIWMIGQGLAALAFAVVMVGLLAGRPPLAGALADDHLHDLGNLLLAFVMLWAYVAFSQYLIIWSANLPEEIPWYLHRAGGGWQAIAVVLTAFHFFVPFLVLLSRATKRNLRALVAVAAAILVMRWVDLYWMIAPAFAGGAVRFHWMDLLAPVGVGGLWLGLFARKLESSPLLPLYAPPLGRTGDDR